MTTQIKIDNMLAVESNVIGKDTILLCKETPHKWHLATPEGAVLFTSKTKKAAVLDLSMRRKAAVKDAAKAPKKSAKVASTKKQTAPKKTAAKVDSVRADTNLHHLKFGKDVDAKTVKGYVSKIWGGTFKVTNIHHEDGHYWKGDISHGKETVENYRLDYFLNWAKMPGKLKTPETVAVQKKVIAAAAK